MKVASGKIGAIVLIDMSHKRASFNGPMDQWTDRLMNSRPSDQQTLSWLCLSASKNIFIWLWCHCKNRWLKQSVFHNSTCIWMMLSIHLYLNNYKIYRIFWSIARSCILEVSFVYPPIFCIAVITCSWILP